jgi:large subunit ribosomal protein L4
MIEVPVYNMEGEQTGTFPVEEAAFGGRVRVPLLKQACVMYQANKRQGTAATKSRGMVAGSTRKIYRQKGTGNARMGTIRTPIRRGGGVAFAKSARDLRQELPKRARRLARDSAILSKLLSGDVVLVEGLSFSAFASMLGKLGIERSVLVALVGPDANVLKSGRNLVGVTVCTSGDLNAYEICRHHKLLLAREVMEILTRREAGAAATAMVPAVAEAAPSSG